MSTSLETIPIMDSEPAEVLLVSSEDAFLKDFNADQSNLLQIAMRALQITAAAATVAVTTPPSSSGPVTNSLSKPNHFNATDRYNQKLITPPPTSEIKRGGSIFATFSFGASCPPAVPTAITGPPQPPAIPSGIPAVAGPEKLISLREVSQHDSMDDCWIVVFDRVYDITNFLLSHPGGHDVIMENAGRDATFAFQGSGHSREAVRMLKKYEIGILPMYERLYRKSALSFWWGELPE